MWRPGGGRGDGGLRDSMTLPGAKLAALKSNETASPQDLLAMFEDFGAPRDL